jgi:hypothetical protein
LERASPATVVASRDVRGYFKESVEQAMQVLRLRAAEHTIHYVVNLLALYARADNLYEAAPAGARDLQPLAFMLRDALEAPTVAAQRAAFRRLGDVALFIGGFFAQSLARKPVDVDYYIAMGGSAYGALSESFLRVDRREAPQAVYAELADKFARFVDVLAEISACAHPSSDRDILRLYEIWLRTGSARARARLVELGVLPTSQPPTRQ